MSGMMNNFYYGKAGQADFTPEQLPANRVQLFFSMFRIRFSGLIGMNLLYLLFALPAILWTIFNLMAISGAGTAYSDAGELISQATVSTQELLGYVNVYLLGMIPCLMILAFGTTGVTYVLRNWARDQHSFVMSDFKDAIKNNWKQTLLVGLINGLSLTVTFVCYRYYGMMAQESVFWIIPRTLVVCICALWWIVNMLLFPMMVTYDMKFGTLVRNSFIMGLARLPFTLLFAVLPPALTILAAFYVPYGWIVMIVFYLLIGMSGVLFMQVSYAVSCFDRYLNPRIEGAKVNMGLRDPKYNDEEDDEEDENDPTLPKA